MSFTFGKNERLRGFRLIRKLFTRGRSFHFQSFKVTWLKTDQEGTLPPRMMVSVPKNLHKKAMQRNILKRRVKEAYRLNKSILPTNNNNSGPDLIFCITYATKEILTFREIQDKIILILRRLKEECEKVT